MSAADKYAAPAAERPPAVDHGLLDGLSVGVYRSDPGGRLLYANPAMAQIYGFPDRESFMAEEARSFYFDPADREQWRAAIERGDTLHGHEIRQLRRDGVAIWVRESGRCERDPQGRVLYYEGVLEDITEQKRLTEVLRVAQRDHEALVHSIDGIVWEADAHTFQFSFVSEPARRILGYPTERWLGEPTFWKDHVHPEDRDWVVAFCLKATAEKRPHDFEYRMIAADGRSVWFREVVTVVVENDQPVKLRGLMVDITSSKQAELELRQLGDLLQTVLTSVSDHVWSAEVGAGGEWVYRYCSPVVETLTGRPPEFFRHGREAWLSTIHPEDQPRLLEAFERVSTGQSRHEEEECRIALPDGAIRWLRGSAKATPLAEGRLRLDGVVSDITERKRAEEALRASEERYRLLVENAPICIHEIDRGGRLISMNQAGLGMMGFSTESQLLATDYLDAVCAADRPRVAGLLARALVGESARFEFVAAGEGQPRTLASSLIPIQGKDGVIQRLMGLTEDITERKRVEGQRARFSGQLQALAQASVLIHAARSVEEATAIANGKAQEIVGAHTSVAGLIEALVAREGRNSPVQVSDEHQDAFRESDEAILVQLAQMLSVAIENARLLEWTRQGRQRLQSLSRRLVVVQEAERRRIARELHDEIGQILTGLKLMLETNDHGSAEARGLVNELMRRVRDLSMDLRPAMLDDLGLLPALLWHVERYTAQTQVHVDFHHSRLDRRFYPELETTAFRIVQEALTNVARHAAVKEVTVRIRALSDRLTIKVEDRGRGFDAEAVQASHSAGLAGMSERAHLLEGRLDVESSPGSGTRVSADLPLVGRKLKEKRKRLR